MIGGLIAFTSALIYAEFASQMPFSGAGYAYVYATFGELPAWMVGWNMNMRFGGSASALSRGWTSYLVGLLAMLGIVTPTWLYSFTFLGYVSFSMFDNKE